MKREGYLRLVLHTVHLELCFVLKTASSTEMTMRYNLSTREMAGAAFQSKV